MRSLLGVLTVSLFTTAAHAEIMGTIPIGPVGLSGDLPETLACGTTLTWKVSLQASKDYAFVSWFDRYGTATLRTPGGSPVMSFQVIPSSGTDMATGHEAHASVTGAYFLDVKIGPPSWNPDYGCPSDGSGYGLAFQYDCLGGRRTRCTLPVGTTRKSYFTFPEEWDWWKVTLQAGKQYDITTNTVVNLVLRDQRGQPVVRADAQFDGSPPAIRGFRARVSGTYFVDVEDVVFDAGENATSIGPYTVTLKVR